MKEQNDLENKNKVKCNCVKINCERHGKCKECIQHHLTSKRYPVPYCERKKRKKNPS